MTVVQSGCSEELKCLTTRFSLSELADMLHVRVEMVRQAVEALETQLTGESFIYNDRTWRIAPSDVKRIKVWIDAHGETLEDSSGKRARRVRVKKIVEKGHDEDDRTT